MSMTESPAHRQPPVPWRLLSVPACLRRLARSVQTAHWLSQSLGSAEITHPFHPLRGRRFVVLKLRKVSGVETLSLRHTEMGSFAVPREWTDWAPSGTSSEPTPPNGRCSLTPQVRWRLPSS